MKTKILGSLLILMLGTPALYSLKNESLLNQSMKQNEPKIFINNRILAHVNGKPISTYDLMKKMDLSFFRQYPQYTSSVEARSQYYNMSWKYVLEDMIDKELILADAKESKIEVSSGDVRQEMELSFGPNIIANLDKAGISFEEATKIMQEEIIIRRMISGRVHSKAVRQITPIKVRQAYEDFIHDPDHAKQTQWAYRIVTVKDRHLEKTEETAKAAYQLLMEGITLDDLITTMKERHLLGRKAKVTVSGIIKNNDKEISSDYRDMLLSLDAGMYSQPFASKSRANQTTVYRIVAINEKIPGGMPSFKEMEARLKDQLLSHAIDRETQAYVEKLRAHYHIRQHDLEAHLPSDYKPFELR